MLYRDYKGGKNISQLGFGAMRLPQLSTDPKDIDKKTTEAIIMRAFELGVNYFDTAYVYHNGASETVLGEILRNNHIDDKVNIADKLPTFWIEENFKPFDLFDEQLRRLGTDRIDYYLIHNLNKDKWAQLKNKGILEFMEKTRNSGKIGTLGFSFHDNFDAYREIIDDYDWEFSQIQLNFMDIEYQAGIKGLEYAASKGIPVIIMEPLKGGQLMMLQDPQVSALKEKYGLSDIPTAEICLNFLFDRPEVLTVLSGMNALCQLEQNVVAASKTSPGTMPEGQKLFLNELRAYILTKNMIPCTGCSYCTEGCPQEIPIPDLFEMYNNGIMFDSQTANRAQYQRFYTQTKDCVNCGQCESVCPQKLAIPELLKTANAYLKD